MEAEITQVSFKSGVNVYSTRPAEYGDFFVIEGEGDAAVYKLRSDINNNYIKGFCTA